MNKVAAGIVGSAMMAILLVGITSAICSWLGASLGAYIAFTSIVAFLCGVIAAFSVPSDLTVVQGGKK